MMRLTPIGTGTAAYFTPRLDLNQIRRDGLAANSIAVHFRQCRVKSSAALGNTRKVRLGLFDFFCDLRPIRQNPRL
jgi:hypothetical protein